MCIRRDSGYILWCGQFEKDFVGEKLHTQAESHPMGHKADKT